MNAHSVSRSGVNRLINTPIPNTLNLPVRARELLRIIDAPSAFSQPWVRNEWLGDPEALVLGGASNILFVRTELDKAISLGMRAYGAIDLGERVRVFADGGVGLDEWVRWSAAQGWYGLERLAEIPGTVGAAPIQNVGAYGVQISDVLDAVALWDRHKQEYVVWRAEECGLSYRHSRFKDEPGRWLVMRIWVILSKHAPRDWPHLGYPGLESAAARYLESVERARHCLTPAELATIVTNVRRQKLPDWRSDAIGSVGSFFQNPIVARELAANLAERWPDMPQYPQDAQERVKLSAGWLIERAGWKGKALGAAGMSAIHALVLVNHGGATGQALWDVAQQVQADVYRQFGVRLEPEPLIWQ